MSSKSWYQHDKGWLASGSWLKNNNLHDSPKILVQPNHGFDPKLLPIVSSVRIEVATTVTMRWPPSDLVVLYCFQTNYKIRNASSFFPSTDKDGRFRFDMQRQVDEFNAFLPQFQHPAIQMKAMVGVWRSRFLGISSGKGSRSSSFSWIYGRAFHPA